ncbi:MAG: hypothetical protein QXP34_00925 [Candidatus Aenigmatarchaeota archaeon]
MRYRVIFQKRWDNAFCVDYKFLWRRGESFLAYVVALNLQEKGLLRENLFNFSLLEEELSKIVKRIGNTFLVSCFFLNDLNIEEKNFIQKGILISGIRNFSFLQTKNFEKNIFDFSQYKTYISNNLEGKGASANKLWDFELIRADSVSFIIESDLSKEEIYNLFKGKTFTFFAKKRFNFGEYVCKKVEECEERIVKFIPIEDLEEITKYYKVEILNDVVIRVVKHFVSWYGEKVNGVLCSIGSKTEKKENEKGDSKLREVYKLKDLDLRLGSVLWGVKDRQVEKKGLIEEEAICGLCRYKGIVYRKKTGTFWDSFTQQNLLYNTEYLCESCLRLKSIENTEKRRYRRFIQVGDEIFDWDGREVDKESLAQNSVVIACYDRTLQSNFYFAEANYLFGKDVKFLLGCKEGKEQWILVKNSN